MTSTTCYSSDVISDIMAAGSARVKKDMEIIDDYNFH